MALKISDTLRKLAKIRGIDPNRMRAVFALERIVARLETIPTLSNSLVYKGGFVLFKTTDTDRLTRDVDAVAHGLSRDEAVRLSEKAVSIDLNDGLSFFEVKTTLTQVTGKYEGLRVKVAFSIDDPDVPENKLNRLPQIHFDIGFGTYLPEKKLRSEMISVTEVPDMTISWAVLPHEYIFAEKLQTTIVRGEPNTRGKDIYDMWYLSHSLSNNSELRLAIEQVFSDRDTPLPAKFSESLTNFNLSNLRQSWNTIQFKSNDISFDQAFSELIQFLG